VGSIGQQNLLGLMNFCYRKNYWLRPDRFG